MAGCANLGVQAMGERDLLAKDEMASTQRVNDWELDDIFLFQYKKGTSGGFRAFCRLVVVGCKLSKSAQGIQANEKNHQYSRRLWGFLAYLRIIASLMPVLNDLC